MTRRQRQLARHALGLPNRRNTSYRNRYVAAYCPGDYDQWAIMVEGGLAEQMPLRGGTSMARFYLTQKGAEMALDPGEYLCAEDFPK